jgi:uncharacterized MAPEG superfamily protein
MSLASARLLSTLSTAESDQGQPIRVALSIVIGIFYLMNFMALVKAVNPHNHPAEDSKIGLSEEEIKKYDDKVKAQGGVDRWTRVSVNQGECFPVQLFTLWVASVHAPDAAWCVFAYLIFRINYIVCYLFALAPWRTFQFLFSFLSALVAGVLGINAARAKEEEEVPVSLALTSVAVLFVLMNFFARLKSADPNNHPAEDAVLGATADKKEEFKRKKEESGGVDRWHRIAENQAEQLPYALYVFAGAQIVGGNTTALFCCICAYAAFRVIYVVCYLLALSPWRTIIFMLGQLTCLATIGVGIAGCGGDIGKLLAMSCTGLFFLMNMGATIKAVDPNNHPAEDSKIGLSDEGKQRYADRVKAQGGVDRWGRIAANQGENFPLALLELWASYVFSPMNAPYCFVAYFVFRALYIVCYLKALAPWRTICFMLGNVSCFVAIGVGVAGVL